MYVYIYLYLYLYTYMYRCACIYARIYIYIHRCMYLYACTCLCILAFRKSIQPWILAANQLIRKHSSVAVGITETRCKTAVGCRFAVGHYPSSFACSGGGHGVWRSFSCRDHGSSCFCQYSLRIDMGSTHISLDTTSRQGLRVLAENHFSWVSSMLFLFMALQEMQARLEPC